MTNVVPGLMERDESPASRQVESTRQPKMSTDGDFPRRIWLSFYDSELAPLVRNVKYIKKPIILLAVETQSLPHHHALHWLGRILHLSYQQRHELRQQ